MPEILDMQWKMRDLLQKLDQGVAKKNDIAQLKLCYEMSQLQNQMKRTAQQKTSNGEGKQSGRRRAWSAGRNSRGDSSGSKNRNRRNDQGGFDDLFFSKSGSRAGISKQQREAERKDKQLLERFAALTEGKVHVDQQKQTPIAERNHVERNRQQQIIASMNLSHGLSHAHSYTNLPASQVVGLSSQQHEGSSGNTDGFLKHTGETFSKNVIPGQSDPNMNPEIHAYKLNGLANTLENNAVRREMLESELQECIKRSRAMRRRANAHIISGRPRSANAGSWKASRSTVDSAMGADDRSIMLGGPFGAVGLGKSKSSTNPRPASAGPTLQRSNSEAMQRILEKNVMQTASSTGALFKQYLQVQKLKNDILKRVKAIPNRNQVKPKGTDAEGYPIDENGDRIHVDVPPSTNASLNEDDERQCEEGDLLVENDDDENGDETRKARPSSASCAESIKRKKDVSGEPAFKPIVNSTVGELLVEDRRAGRLLLKPALPVQCVRSSPTAGHKRSVSAGPARSVSAGPVRDDNKPVKETADDKKSGGNLLGKKQLSKQSSSDGHSKSSNDSKTSNDQKKSKGSTKSSPTTPDDDMISKKTGKSEGKVKIPKKKNTDPNDLDDDDFGIRKKKRPKTADPTQSRSNSRANVKNSNATGDSTGNFPKSFDNGGSIGMSKKAESLNTVITGLHELLDEKLASLPPDIAEAAGSKRIRPKSANATYVNAPLRKRQRQKVFTETGRHYARALLEDLVDFEKGSKRGMKPRSKSAKNRKTMKEIYERFAMFDEGKNKNRPKKSLNGRLRGRANTDNMLNQTFTSGDYHQLRAHYGESVPIGFTKAEDVVTEEERHVVMTQVTDELQRESKNPSTNKGINAGILLDEEKLHQLQQQQLRRKSSPVESTKSKSSEKASSSGSNNVDANSSSSACGDNNTSPSSATNTTTKSKSYIAKRLSRLEPVKLDCANKVEKYLKAIEDIINDSGDEEEEEDILQSLSNCDSARNNNSAPNSVRDRINPRTKFLVPSLQLPHPTGTPFEHSGTPLEQQSCSSGTPLERTPAHPAASTSSPAEPSIHDLVNVTDPTGVLFSITNNPNQSPVNPKSSPPNNVQPQSSPQQPPNSYPYDLRSSSVFENSHRAGGQASLASQQVPPQPLFQAMRQQKRTNSLVNGNDGNADANGNRNHFSGTTQKPNGLNNQHPKSTTELNCSTPQEVSTQDRIRAISRGSNNGMNFSNLDQIVEQRIQAAQVRINQEKAKRAKEDRTVVEENGKYAPPTMSELVGASSVMQNTKGVNSTLQSVAASRLYDAQQVAENLSTFRNHEVDLRRRAIANGSTFANDAETRPLDRPSTADRPPTADPKRQRQHQVLQSQQGVMQRSILQDELRRPEFSGLDQNVGVVRSKDEQSNNQSSNARQAPCTPLEDLVHEDTETIDLGLNKSLLDQKQAVPARYSPQQQASYLIFKSPKDQRMNQSVNQSMSKNGSMGQNDSMVQNGSMGQNGGVKQSQNQEHRQQMRSSLQHQQLQQLQEQPMSSKNVNGGMSSSSSIASTTYPNHGQSQSGSSSSSSSVAGDQDVRMSQIRYPMQPGMEGRHQVTVQRDSRHQSMQQDTVLDRRPNITNSYGNSKNSNDLRNSMGNIMRKVSDLRNQDMRHSMGTLNRPTAQQKNMKQPLIPPTLWEDSSSDEGSNLSDIENDFLEGLTGGGSKRNQPKNFLSGSGNPSFNTRSKGIANPSIATFNTQKIGNALDNAKIPLNNAQPLGTESQLLNSLDRDCLDQKSVSYFQSRQPRPQAQMGMSSQSMLVHYQA